MDEAQSSEQKKRRTFTDEFKQDTVRLITVEKYTFKAAAAALGVGEQNLRSWHRKLAPQPEPCGEDDRLDVLTVSDVIEA